MARVVLVGLPGAGKTSVAREVAARWGCPAVDTDDLLGAPAATLLREGGEAGFRRAEAAALTSALDLDVVVSTGGGVVTTEVARAALTGQVTVWLDADDDTLLARCADGDRPLLGDDPAGALARLRAEREPLYARVARARVDASGPVAEVADRV
ncbi:MAG TPA: shikimate kinase, partial [Acidimicrobiales bacterium]|nr:shikimate kinase [Acidimicrobiales bacterium]